MRLQGHVDTVSLTEITGWAIDRDQPRSTLEISIVVDGAEVGRCKTDIERKGLAEALGDDVSDVHAFRFVFNPPLDRREHHHIEVLTSPNSVLLPNGRQTLYRTNASDARYTPILLTSNGRCGTTMLMQEFATHPDIAVANAYPFEFKLTSYYAAAWSVLTQSTHIPTADDVDFAARAGRDLLIGRNPWNRTDLLGSLGGPLVARLISKKFPDKLARLFSTNIEESYDIIAARNEKTPHFLAEKSTIDRPMRQACRILFPVLKEIVLVRDPRDHLCSATKFWGQDIAEILRTHAIELPELMKIHDEHRTDVLFVRYEDLVLDAARSRKQIYDFIGCDAGFKPREVAADLVPSSHKTSASATESIGRFRTELDAPAVEACQERFGAFMKMFDYKPVDRTRSSNHPPPIFGIR